jgi:hypothetical protein
VALVDRVQKILTQPAAEWPVIAAEPATVGGLYTGYIMPLAAIPAIAALVLQVVFTHHVIAGVVGAAIAYVLSLVGVYAVSFIAAALAPSFGGANDQIQGLKWAAYSNTAAWVAGIANIIPIAGALVVLVGAVYTLYLYWLGTVPMMRVPQDKAIGYAVVVIICAIVVYAVIAFAVGLVVAMFAVGSAITSGAIH